MQQQNEISEKFLDAKPAILLTLRPAFNNKLSDSITLKLWLTRDWAEKIKENNRVSYHEKGIINLIANQEDARVLHVPSEGSTINFFGDKSLLIKHKATLLQININGKAYIERESSNEIVARLISGFVIITEPQYAFEEKSFEWLWSSNNGILHELRFGKNKLQLKIKSSESTSKEKKSSLFEFIGRTRLKEGILWKLTACENDPTLQTGKEKFDNIRASIKKICDNIKPIESAKAIFSMSNKFNPENDEMDADVYLEVRSKTTKEFIAKEFITEEFYKVNIKVKLSPEDEGGYSTLSKQTNWEVYTLKVENNEYKLYNYDEIQFLLDNIIINQSENTDLLIKWESKLISGRQQPLKRSVMSKREGKPNTEIMPLYLVGAQADGAIVSNGNLAKDGYLWQPINLKIIAQDFPPAIVRYQLDENLPEPVSASSDSRISSRLKTLEGSSFAFHGLPDRNFPPTPNEQLGWKLTIDMPDSYADQNTSMPLRIAMVLKEVSEAVDPPTVSYHIELHLNGVEVRLETPQMQFFASKQYNSEFLPYMKKYDQNRSSGNLIFKNTLSSDSASKFNAKLIKAKLTSTGFEFRSDLNATKVYVPNNVALINSVSAINPNIGMDITYNFILLSKSFNAGVTFSSKPSQYIIEFPNSDKAFKNDYLGHILQIARIDVATKILITETYKITQQKFVEPKVQFVVEAIEHSYELFKPPTGTYEYDVCIGVNKYVLQRDSNQGLIPINCKQYKIETSNGLPKILVSEYETTPGIEAIMSMLPWVESYYNARNDSNTLHLYASVDNVYHRNLVLEHSEVLLAKEYDKNTNSSLNLVNCVRDYYCTAATFNGKEQANLINWLPNSKIRIKEDPSKKVIEPFCSIVKTDEFPKIKLDWKDDKGKTIVVGDNTQSLSIANQENNWLNYECELYTPPLDNKKINLMINPVNLGKPKSQTINSYTPLIVNDDIYYDNLGLITSKSSISMEEERFYNWSIKTINLEEKPQEEEPQIKTYYSVNVSNDIICSDFRILKTGEIDLNNITQVIFSCADLKIPDAGKLEPDSIKRPFDPGVYGFYSSIRGAENPNKLNIVDHYPRYRGIPFYVTRLTNLNFEKQMPVSMCFQAVLINPEKIANAEADAILDEIKMALATNSVVTFNCDLINRTIQLNPGSKINWSFSYIERIEENKLNSPLVSISGQISDSKSDRQRIILEVNNDSKALILNEIWNLAISDTINLTSSSKFRGEVLTVIKISLMQNNKKKANLQIRNLYHFHVFKNATHLQLSTNIDQKYVGCLIKFTHTQKTYYGTIIEYKVISSKDDLYASIGVLFSKQIPITQETFEVEVLWLYQLGYQFESFTDYGLTISTVKENPLQYQNIPVAFTFEKNISLLNEPEQPLNATIDKVNGLCLILGKEIFRFSLIQGLYHCFTSVSLSQALILWIENTIDLEPLLCGTLVKACNQEFSMFFGDKVKLLGHKASIVIYTYRVNDIQSLDAWRVVEYASCLLNNEEKNCELSLDDQLIYDTANKRLNISGYFSHIIPGKYNRVLQFPALLELNAENYDNISLRLIDNFYYAKPITTVNTIDPNLNVILPGSKEGLLVKEINLVKDSGFFVYIKFEGKFKFFKVNKDKIPLDLCLEQEMSAFLPKQDNKQIQISHRDYLGCQLRLDLTKAETIYSDNTEKTEFQFGLHEKWLFSPIMMVGDVDTKSIVLLEDNLFLEKQEVAGNTLATESVLIFNSVSQPVYSLLAVSSVDPSDKKFSETINEEKFLLTNEQIEHKILDTGASGVALRIKRSKNADFICNFVASPFYRLNSQIKRLTEQPKLLHALFGTSERLKIDSRLLDPKSLITWSYDYTNAYYQPGTYDAMEEKGYSVQAQNLNRTFRYLYNANDLQTSLQTSQNGKPFIIISDKVEFLNKEKNWYLPILSDAVDKRAFLPKALDFKYGSDKPGAMFQHYIRHVVLQNGERTKHWIMGNSTTYALREPQQIAIIGDIKPSIEKLEVEHRIEDQIANFSLSWTYVTGKIPFDDLKLSVDSYQSTVVDEIVRLVKLVKKDELQFEFIESHKNQFSIILNINNKLIKANDSIQVIPTYNYTINDQPKRAWSLIKLASKQILISHFSKNVNVMIDKLQNVDFIPYIALKSEAPHFETTDLLFKPGLKLAKEGPWSRSDFPNPDSSFYKVFPLTERLSSEADKNGYFVYNAVLPNKEINDSTEIQIFWLANIHVPGEAGQLLYQMGWINFYSAPKKVISVIPEVMSENVASVISAADTNGRYSKTLFFGGAKYSFPTVTIDQDNQLVFSSNDSESITTPLTKSIIQGTKKLYLIKYLAGGQIIKGVNNMAGRITNNTGETILVYGPPLGSTYHNSLYFLPSGRKTPSGWDCDGLYVSNDRLVKQALMPDKRGPVAVKYSGGRFPVITLSGNKYECPFNEGVFTPEEMVPGGRIYWEVPNISRSNIPGNYPEVPNHVPMD